jgi:hypothetical protein
VAYIDDATPSFHLTNDDVARIKAIGAQVDLDLIRTEIHDGRRRTTQRRKLVPKRAWFTIAAETLPTSPTLAIIEAARVVEFALKAAAPEDARNQTLGQMLGRLSSWTRLSHADVDFLKMLWRVRSEALHSGDFEPTRRQATELIKRAQEVTDSLAAS